MRRLESDDEWNRKCHNCEESLAIGTMEIIGEETPYTLNNAIDISDISSNHSHVYEYSWNIGLTGEIGFDWLEYLDPEDTLLVQFIIDNEGSRFIAREVFATLEYLPPTKNIMDTPKILKRIFTFGSEVAKNVKKDSLGALSSLISDIIPSTDDYKWYLNRFDYPFNSSNNNQAFGIEWHISRRLIEQIGARLVGRLGVIFIDAPIQNDIEPEQTSMSISGKFGLKLKSDSKHWYGFSMVPLSMHELSLKINPVTKD